jgi:hypothetical protein
MANYIHIPLTKEEEEDIDRMFDGSSFEEEVQDGYEEQCDFGEHITLLWLYCMLTTQQRPVTQGLWI